jgi:hypothetical protein
MLAVSVHAKKEKMNTKIIKLTMTAILLCFLMTSCKKKIEDDYRPEFIGDWQCPIGGTTNYDFGFDLSIDNNANAHYSEYSWDGERDHIKGKARANDHHLKIGRIYSFKIEEYPTRIDTNIIKVYTYASDGTHPLANWEMKLSNTLFHLGAGTYYKADY